MSKIQFLFSVQSLFFLIASRLAVNSQVSSSLQFNVCCPTPSTFADSECKPQTRAASTNSSEVVPIDANVSGLLKTIITQDGLNNSTELESLQLRFRIFLPMCSSTHVGRLLIGPAKDVSHKPENGGNGANINSTDSNGVGSIRPTGYLIFGQHFYPPTEYCIHGINEDEHVLELVICDHVCNANANARKTSKAASSMTPPATPVSCLPKCCEPDQLLDSKDSEFKCVSVHTNFSWNPVLHSHEGSKSHETNESEHESNPKSKSKLHFIHAHPNNWCKTDGFFMYQRDFPMNPKVEFHILKNGEIRYFNEANQAWEHLPDGTYCIDGIYDENLLNQSVHNSSVTEDNNVIYYCPPEYSGEFVQVEESDRNQRISVLYYVVLIISSTFLLLTIVIHAISLDRQNIHGRTLLCCFVSLFCLYVFLAFLHATRLYLDKDPKNTFCWAIGVSLHFFFLSTFSWLSVVNFDLWVTFRTFRTLISPKSHRFKRFVVYSVFAVGAPVVILAIALTMDYLQMNGTAYDSGTIITGPQLIAPGYGQDGCFFSSNAATFVYLYGPIGFLLVMNLLLFILTIVSMYKLKKTSSIATSTSNSYANHPRQSFHLFLKLFVLMGVSWIFEVISWAAHPKTIPWYWVIFDLINICQGIFIFFIFTCKRSTVRVLEQKYPCIKGVTDSCRLCIASFSCARNCPSGSSSANNTTIQEMTARKLSDTVETEIGPT